MVWHYLIGMRCPKLFDELAGWYSACLHTLFAFAGFFWDLANETDPVSFVKVAARCTVPKLYNKSTTSIWMELESFQKSQPSPLGVLNALRNFTRYVHCVIQIIAQVSCIMSFIEGGSVTKMNNRRVFFCPSPLRVSGLKSYSRTSGGTNHHRQSVSDVKNGAISTEPRGRLMNNPHGTCEWDGMCFLFIFNP